MKKSTNLLLALFFVFAGAMFSCAGDSSNNNDNDTTVIEEVIEDTSEVVNVEVDSNKVAAKYICPAHCDGSDSETPGTCPVCGMELIENPDL